MIRCKYRRESKCLLNRFENITNGRCLGCQQNAEDRIVGLGDLVALTINVSPLHRLKPLLNRGGRDCGCKKRQERLNKIKTGRTKTDVIVLEGEGEAWIDKDRRSCGCRAKEKN